MNVWALVAVAAAGVAGLLYSRKGNAMPTGTLGSSKPDSFSLDYLFEKYGQKYGVDPLLLKAVAMVESSLNPNAVRNNPPYDVSVGVMQVLCLPGPNGACSNRFNVDGWQGMTHQALMDPETNIAIGAQILAWNLKTFGSPRGIAVYNSWTARHAGVNGPFPNDSYVRKVLYNFNRLKG